jgi:hypothetical protein
VRIGLLLVTAVLLPACGSTWKAYGIDTACVDELYFEDGDGDLWGDPADAGQESCVPPTGTVRNNRDCDDSNDQITGRTGSLCPEHLVHHDASDPSDLTDFAAVRGASEFIIVHAETDLVWPAAAEDACGPWGWGGCTEGTPDECGHLATVEGQPQLNSLLDALPSGDVFAGWVGFGFDVEEEEGAGDENWGYRDSAGDWHDDDAGIAALRRLCDPTRDYSTTGTTYLALVVDSAGDWCLGTPDEADLGSGDPPYLPLYGHFICERPIPDPDEFALEELPSEE